MRWKDIPVIINNHDRLSGLKILLPWLANLRFSKIIIFDNASSYPPLLDFYESIKSQYMIVRCPTNMGPLSIWHYDGFPTPEGRFFYTDSDVVPDDSCPDNICEIMVNVLDKFPEVFKVGPCLRIDDLPDHYFQKQKVIDWESKHFWKEKFDTGFGVNAWKGGIATTFALWKSARWDLSGVRLDFPYAFRHLPWYTDSDNPTEEDVYYNSTCAFGAWASGAGVSGAGCSTGPPGGSIILGFPCLRMI